MPIRNMRRVQSILLLLLACTVQLCAGAHSLEAHYVPWGVDEYEFFGLTKPQLAARYKNKLEFEDDYLKAFFPGHKHAGFGQPNFDLTFANGKVVSVQRIFLDGAGCKLKGPNLSSKKDALRFSIDGLSKLGNRDKEDEARYQSAMKMLNETEKASR